MSPIVILLIHYDRFCMKIPLSNYGVGFAGEIYYSPKDLERPEVAFCRGMPRPIPWSDVSRQFAPIVVSAEDLFWGRVWTLSAMAEEG